MHYDRLSDAVAKALREKQERIEQLEYQLTQTQAELRCACKAHNEFADIRGRQIMELMNFIVAAHNGIIDITHEIHSVVDVINCNCDLCCEYALVMED